jgi:hypothetical protein
MMIGGYLEVDQMDSRMALVETGHSGSLLFPKHDFRKIISATRFLKHYFRNIRNSG